MKSEFTVGVREAAEMLRVARSTLVRRAAQGLIEVEKRGKGKTAPCFFRREDLMEMKKNPPKRGRPQKKNKQGAAGPGQEFAPERKSA